MINMSRWCVFWPDWMSSNIGKRKRGMIERERYHKLKSEKDRQSHVSSVILSVPSEKEVVKRATLGYFKRM